MVCVRVPATSANLGPGFDCLGLALEIHNQLEVSVVEQASFTVEGEGASLLRSEGGKLIRAAAERLFRETGRRPGDLSIRLRNEVPVARGLGSSATAIVGGLVAANELAGRPLKGEDLLRLAVDIEGHPDNVTPALMGGLTVACQPEDGEGPPLFVRFDPPPHLAVAVIVPASTLPTKESRSVLPASVARGDAIFNIQRACLLVAALREGRFQLLNEALRDRLHQPYRKSLLPGLAEVLEPLRRPGILGTCLSGSGSSVLVFLDPEEQDKWRQGLEEVADIFSRHGIESRVIFTSPASEGAQVVP